MSGAVLKGQRDTGPFFIVLQPVPSSPESSRRGRVPVWGHALCSGRPPSCRGSRARMRSLPLGCGEVLSEYTITFSPSVGGFWLKRRV